MVPAAASTPTKPVVAATPTAPAYPAPAKKRSMFAGMMKPKPAAAPMRGKRFVRLAAAQKRT